MIARLRRRHRRIFVVLAIVLPALVALGLAARSSASVCPVRASRMSYVAGAALASRLAASDSAIVLGGSRESGEATPWE